MKCLCGFKFAGPGEFRNCEAFITTDGKSGVICPKCDRKYVDGQETIIKKNIWKEFANLVKIVSTIPSTVPAVLTLIAIWLLWN